MHVMNEKRKPKTWEKLFHNMYPICDIALYKGIMSDFSFLAPLYFLHFLIFVFFVYIKMLFFNSNLNWDDGMVWFFLFFLKNNVL